MARVIIFGWVILSIMLVLLLIVGFKQWRIWQLHRQPRTNLVGMVQVTEAHLSAIKIRALKYKLDHTTIPQNLRMYLKKLTPKDLGILLNRYAFAWREPVHPHVSAEITQLQAVVTVAAAIYGFEIPHALFRFDEETALFYRRYRAESEPYYIRTDELLKRDKEEFVKPERPYLDYFPILAQLLSTFAQHSQYPSIDVFFATFNYNLNRHRGVRLRLDEVKTLVTVFASLTGLCVPRSYIETGPLTITLIHVMLTTKTAEVIPLERKDAK